jgi:hypothetical protein
LINGVLVEPSIRRGKSTSRRRVVADCDQQNSAQFFRWARNQQKSGPHFLRQDENACVLACTTFGEAQRDKGFDVASIDQNRWLRASRVIVRQQHEHPS